MAGYFYPSEPHDLREMIEGMVDPQAKKEKAIAVISPHAGYVYSGNVAGRVFSSVALPEDFIIIGPNHQEVSTGISIMRQGIWKTPLGDVAVNSDLADLVMEGSRAVKENDKSHSQEHSLEVQLPFIQYLKGNISFVPISIAYFADYDDLAGLGKAIGEAVSQFSGRQVLIVASTDMSHYVDQETAKRKDLMAIEKILDLDAWGLYEIVKRENISMCGFQAVTAAIVAANELNAKEAELMKYQTSGDASGDFSRVVGYAGIRII